MLDGGKKLTNVIATVPRRSGGRARDPQKDAAIVAAAHQAFMERGFDAMTMEEIAARAGVSKVTVYNRFPDKQSLFMAVVSAKSAEMQRALLPDDVSDAALEARLNAFGIALLSFLYDGAHVRFKRAMMVLLQGMPELSRRFFDVGPGGCRTRVAGVLREAAERGEIAVPCPIRAAEDLMSLWKGFDDVEMEFGLIDALDDGRIAEKVHRGTANFLRMVRPA